MMNETEDALSRLSKKTREKFRKANEVTSELLPTASFGINLNVGGLPVGGQTTIYGNEQGGKSAFMLNTVALNQQLDVPCAWIYSEKRFSHEWAAKNGVDTNSLIVAKTGSIGAMTDQVVELIESGFRLIVIDSTSALMPGSFYEDADNLKDFEGTKQLGQQARELGQASRMINGVNWNAAVVMISQVRIDLGASGMNKPFKMSGGKEIGHLDALRIRLQSGKSDLIKGTIGAGENFFEEFVGRRASWSIEKNNINGRYCTGGYNLMTDGGNIGVDKYRELVDYGELYGKVEKAGTWFSVYGEKKQGADAMAKHLRENPQLAEKLEAEILGGKSF